MATSGDLSLAIDNTPSTLLKCVRNHRQEP